MVGKVSCGPDQPLKERDVVLTLNGTLVTRVSDLDIMYDQAVLDTVIIRDRQEMRLDVPTVSTEDLETDHVVIFCGALLHRPHHAVRQQISKIHSEVYVSARVCSSPNLRPITVVLRYVQICRIVIVAFIGAKADIYRCLGSRIARLSVFACPDQLHHGRQWHTNTQSRVFCQGGHQDS